MKKSSEDTIEKEEKKLDAAESDTEDEAVDEKARVDDRDSDDDDGDDDDDDDGHDDGDDDEAEEKAETHRSTKGKRDERSGKKGRSEHEVVAASRDGGNESAGRTVSMSRALLFGAAALIVGAVVGWTLRDARAEDGSSKRASAAVDTSAGACDSWKDQICDGTSQESAACDGAKAAMGLLPTAACDVAIEDMPGTLEKIKAARASCDQLVTKLCADLGEESTGCQIVKAKTPSIPPEGCKEMLGNYDEVLSQLQRIGQPRPGMGGPPHGIPGPGGPPHGMPGPGGPPHSSPGP